MFPITSSSSTLSQKSNQSTRSIRSQSNFPESPSQIIQPQSNFVESPGGQSNQIFQSNFVESPGGQSNQISQSNFPVKFHAPPPLHYHHLPPPFVPALATTGTQYDSSMVVQPYTWFIPTPPVTVPCTTSGTHITILQGNDHVSNLTSNPIHLL